jgi:uncharacterized membrane protein YraQ (UPF0718 family)
MRIVTGLSLICLAVLLAGGGLVLVQRLRPARRRLRHNDVAGFINAVLGVAYAVLLGLVVAAVWEERNAAAQAADQGAGEVAEVFWLAHSIPEPEGRHLQQLARSYAQVVVNEEWPLMEQGKTSPRAWAILDDMRGSIQGMKPTTEVQQVLYEQGLRQMHDLEDARAERLFEAEEGLPAILWVVLIVGGIDVVGFTYLFGSESTSVHVLMVASLTLIIALVFFTVAALDYPFKGDIRIGPEAFEQVLGRFESSKLGGS